jgi:hypothetical protein
MWGTLSALIGCKFQKGFLVNSEKLKYLINRAQSSVVTVMADVFQKKGFKCQGNLLKLWK